jgi:MFS family permease
LTIVSTDYVGFALAFALTGAYMSNFTVSWWSAIMDFATEERRPTYLALAGVLRSLPASLAPLAGGIVADAWGSVWVFGIATAAHLISTMMMFSVLISRKGAKPSATRTREVMPRVGVPEVVRP